jgi:hypothetical protein
MLATEQRPTPEQIAAVTSLPWYPAGRPLIDVDPFELYGLWETWLYQKDEEWGDHGEGYILEKLDTMQKILLYDVMNKLAGNA